MATRLTTAMATRPTGACTTDPRTTGPSTTAMRITDRSIIAGPTGGLSTTGGPITGQRTSTGVRITGVRTGGDEDDRADTPLPPKWKPLWGWGEAPYWTEEPALFPASLTLRSAAPMSLLPVNPPLFAESAHSATP